MSLATRLALAAALLAGAGDARAEGPGSIPADAQEVTVALGVGAMTTTASLGDERLTSVSLSGSWFPANGHLGGRLYLGFGALDGGTSYVNSERLSNLVSALGTGRAHIAGPLYGFAGAGAGVVVMRTRHRALNDEMVLWTTHPALSWTTGIELAYQEIFFRADHVGAWHGVSRDMLYSLHIGVAL